MTAGPTNAWPNLFPSMIKIQAIASSPKSTGVSSRARITNTSSDRNALMNVAR